MKPRDRDTPERPLAEAEGSAGVGEVDDEEDTAPGTEAPQAAVSEAPAESLAAPVRDELAELRDRYLRLAAEFENYKKRQTRERTETWSRAQSDLVGRLVDALDDLARFAHVSPAETDAATLRQGVELVERKLLKQLEGAGLRRLDPVGEPFDPNHHEAVSTLPAERPEQDHRVAAVLQPGYVFGGALVRPARVVVYTWRPPEDQSA